MYNKGSRRQEGQEREGRNSVEQILRDLWKVGGWDGVHRINKMDTTGTFKKESREFEGGGFGVDSQGWKRSWFWMGEDNIGGGEQLF